MSTITKCTMTQVKTTKGAVMYQNVKEGGGQAVTNLYLRKDGLGANFPGEIEVTITRVDDEGEA